MSDIHFWLNVIFGVINVFIGIAGGKTVNMTIGIFCICVAVNILTNK